MANLSFKSPSPKPHLNRTGSVFALPRKNSGSFAWGRCRRGRREIPHFAVDCSHLPFSSRRIREKRRKTKKKSEENKEKRKKRKKAKKNEEKRKKRENSSDPIYTNLIEDLPKKCSFGVSWLRGSIARLCTCNSTSVLVGRASTLSA